MMEDLRKKNIFITGVTRGIGRAIALALAKQGAGVVFNFREGKQEQAEAFRKELSAAGAPRTCGLLFDVTDVAQMKGAVDGFLREGMALHGLVNNAGISEDRLMLRLKPEDLERTLATNLKGAVFLTQALVRALSKQETSSIVNIGSVIGLMGNAGQLAYSVSKAGLVGLTKSLAREFASRKVRCNIVCPGFIETDMTGSMDKDSWAGRVPLGRLGTPEDVAALVGFLLCDASSYMTGEVIKIDGGLYT